MLITFIINYINIDNLTKYNNNYNVTIKLDWCNGESFLVSSLTYFSSYVTYLVMQKTIWEFLYGIMF